MSGEASIVASLDRWLAGPDVVSRDGAIAGVVDRDGARYWYPEIAGYYLSYLADIGATDERAERIVAWLWSWWRDPEHGRRTRIPVPHRAAEPDWRNAWRFSFDLAMVVRGLSRQPALDTANRLRDDIVAEIGARFVRPDGGLATVVGPAVPLERRGWSTDDSPAQLKTLAALASSSATHFPQGWFEDRSHALLARFPMACWSELPLHPRCYAYEGLLWFDDSATTRAAVRTAIVAALDNERTTSDFQRFDARAQLLRLLLIVAPDASHVETTVRGLIDALRGRVAVPFAVEAPEGEYNIWATLFVRQALQMFLEAPAEPSRQRRDLV